MDQENNFKEFADWIFSLSGLDYTIAATAIAILISRNLNVNEQNSVGNFFFLIGQVLITMNAQDITQSERIDNPTNISNGELNRRIEFLFNELNNIKRNL